MKDFDQLVSSVQENCDIVDANHAQDYGLCIYLLKMRDYYRWKNRIPLTANLENDAVHAWIADTEENWEKIVNHNFKPISVAGEELSPFEMRKINEKLTSYELVYSGGLGYGSVPMFFLAKLHQKEQSHGFTVYTTSDEYARGLFGSPGLFIDDTIFIRRDALRQFVWAYYDEWSFSRLKNTMGQAMSFYPFETSPEEAIEAMTERETGTLIQHEIGEGLINREFGETWKEMLIDFGRSKTEILLRAAKDLAVDCTTTLPYLLSERRDASIVFHFALFSDMRKEIFPELYDSFKANMSEIDYPLLIELVEKGRDFWSGIGKTAISMYRDNGTDARQEIESLIENAVCK